MAIIFGNKIIKDILDEIASKLKNIEEVVDVDPCPTYFITLGDNRKMSLQNQGEADVHWANATIITTDIVYWEQFIEYIKKWQQDHNADINML